MNKNETISYQAFAAFRLDMKTNKLYCTGHGLDTKSITEMTNLLAQIIKIRVLIYLCRGNGGVPKKALDAEAVNTAAQKECREGVPELVRGNAGNGLYLSSKKSSPQCKIKTSHKR